MKKKPVQAVIVKDFQYKKRRCLVVKIDRSRMRKHLKKVSKSMEEYARLKMNNYHNGYVEMFPKERRRPHHRYPQEITFDGILKHLGLRTTSRFIGFDTAHWHNEQNPKTQTARYVEKECRKMVDVMTK